MKANLDFMYVLSTKLYVSLYVYVLFGMSHNSYILIILIPCLLQLPDEYCSSNIYDIAVKGLVPFLCNNKYFSIVTYACDDNT